MSDFECPNPECNVRDFGSASGCMVCAELWPMVESLKKELFELAEEIARREMEHQMYQPRHCPICLKPSTSYMTRAGMRGCPECWDDDPELYPMLSIEVVKR